MSGARAGERGIRREEGGEWGEERGRVEGVRSRERRGRERERERE